jgi:hypothetical protein
MLIDDDKDLKNIALTMKPQWNELRLRQRHFEQHDEWTFSAEDFVLVGQPTVMFCITTRTLGSPWSFDYFPLAIMDVDPASHGSPEWFVFARAGGTSDCDRKLQFLFERPFLRLLEYQEDFADGMGPDAKHESLCFYAGIEFSDPCGQHALRAVASQLADFMFKVDIVV